MTINIGKDTFEVLNILAAESASICLFKSSGGLSLTKSAGEKLFYNNNSEKSVVIQKFIGKMISQGLGADYLKEEHSMNIFDFEGLTIRIQSIPIVDIKNTKNLLHCDIHINIFKKDCDNLRSWLTETEKSSLVNLLEKPDLSKIQNRI